MGSSHSVRIVMAINLTVVGRTLCQNANFGKHGKIQDWLQEDLAIAASGEELPDTFSHVR